MGKSVGTIDFENVSISPKYRKRDWQEAVAEDDWDKMVAIFEDRLRGRFLTPINLISKDRSIGEFAGFSILALDCLLIETLQQFYCGRDKTEGKHWESFWLFFQNSEFFRANFNRRTAETFYSHFRCGILHQAQTKGKSVVRMDQNTMIRPVEDQINKGLIVDRCRFHKALEDEVAAYTDRLRSHGEANEELRRNFIRKMNFICGINQ
ncbi:MAG: hypothetical protein PHP44_06435 [Kiritimatiellae bacterium]|nr:hypothetical protein [Kiritimatiellia bacterium]